MRSLAGRRGRGKGCCLGVKNGRTTYVRYIAPKANIVRGWRTPPPALSRFAACCSIQTAADRGQRPPHASTKARAWPGGFVCRRRQGRQFLKSPTRQLGITVQFPSGPRTKPYWLLATSGLLNIAGWSVGLTPDRLHGTTSPPWGPPPCCAPAGAPANESTTASAMAQPSPFIEHIMFASIGSGSRNAGQQIYCRASARPIGFWSNLRRSPAR
jgi:hypothetical protein